MNKKAIIIGAGQIGRGFIGERLYDSGYDIVFIDAARELVEEINRRNEYRVILLGEEDKGKMIRHVRAVHIQSQNVPYEMLEADIIATAIGPNHIPEIAPVVAEGIRMRYRKESIRPLDIIACENMDGGSTKLYHYVKDCLNREEEAYCSRYIGFPDAEVSRIVVPIVREEPLTVKVEKYMEWMVDKSNVKGDLTHVKGLVLTEHVEAFVKRKIFTLTGHAMLGYLGYEKGWNYIWEAVQDPDIFQTVYRALGECGQAWSLKYGLPLDSFMEYAAYMLIRFGDQRILDACTRPAREPIRKLAATERFFGPALTAMEYGVDPKNIIQGICSVLRYDAPRDGEAVQLQEKLKQKGIRLTLAEITGLDELHPLLERIEGTV